MHARTHATHPPWQRQAAWPGPPMPPGGPATARLALPWKTPPNREGPTLPRERGVAHRLGCPPLVVSPLVQKVLGGWESGGSVARSSQLLCHEAAVRQLSRLVKSPLVHGHAAAKPYLQRLGGREPQFQLVPRSVSSPCQPAHVASPLCWFGHSGAPPPAESTSNGAALRFEYGGHDALRNLQCLSAVLFRSWKPAVQTRPVCPAPVEICVMAGP